MLGPYRSATFSSSSPGSHPALLNIAVSPHAWQPCRDSKRDFYAQPSPSMVLANGAPSALHKKVLELMRRQSDTIKWEQKHNRGTVIP